jgi:ABC-type dipeptide/oligopeptide/nickel transport system permease subunit
MLGLGISAILVFVALFAPWIAPYPGDATGDINMQAKLKPPSSEHLMGTDHLGRDIFSRVLYGTRKSLSIGIGIVLLAFIIGLPLGLIAGYYGGRIDEVLDLRRLSLLSDLAFTHNHRRGFWRRYEGQHDRPCYRLVALVCASASGSSSDH